MKVPDASPQTTQLAMRYGLRFGMALVVLGGGLGVSGALFTLPDLPDLEVGACFFTMLLGVSCAWLLGETGHFTTLAIGAVYPGITASAVAGSIGGVAMGVASSITGLLMGPHSQTALAAAFGIVGSAVGDGLALTIIGAALGSFGADIAKRAYDKRTSTAQLPAPLDAPPRT